jgi:hypothetical protein
MAIWICRDTGIFGPTSAEGSGLPKGTRFPGCVTPRRFDGVDRQSIGGEFDFADPPFPDRRVAGTRPGRNFRWKLGIVT